MTLGCKGNQKEAIIKAQSDYFFELKHDSGYVEIFLPYLPFHNKVLQRRVSVKVNNTPVWFVTAEI